MFDQMLRQASGRPILRVTDVGVVLVCAFSLTLFGVFAAGTGNGTTGATGTLNPLASKCSNIPLNLLWFNIG